MKNKTEHNWTCAIPANHRTVDLISVSIIKEVSITHLSWQEAQLDRTYRLQF